MDPKRMALRGVRRGTCPGGEDVDDGRLHALRRRK